MASDNLFGAPMHGWFYLVRRFQRFLADLDLTDPQVKDGWRKQAGVRATLNRHYWSSSSETDNGFVSGSWGKTLQVRPPRDVDLLFFLPLGVHARFEQRVGNRQSQLLQEVKTVLEQTYSETDMRGDGQAVVVRFASTPVEVIPAFPLNDGRYLICGTENGGRYILTAPHAEIAELDASDTLNRGATRRLILMAKQWQRHCEVPIKSFQVERIAIEFLAGWPHSRDLFWIDWMVRDFFGYLASRAGGVVVMPATGTVVPLGDAWAAKARTAYAEAARAFDYEWTNEDVLAGMSWQLIFGEMIPGWVN